MNKKNHEDTKTQRITKRIGSFILSSLVSLCLGGFLSCAGGKMQPDTARKVIAQDLSIPERRVQVWNVSQLGQTILAEGALRTTFVLQKDSTGKWHILKMKYSDEWESPEKFLQSGQRSSLSRSLESAFINELGK